MCLAKIEDKFNPHDNLQFPDVDTPLSYKYTSNTHY